MKKVIFGISLSVLLGAGAALGVTYSTGDSAVAIASPTASIASQTTDKIDETMDQLSFKMKKPKKLPFEKTDILISQKDLGKGKLVELSYKDKQSKGYLVFEATDMKRKLATEKYEITEVTLPNGTIAQYIDNGVVQVLYWEQDDLSYSVHATRGDGKKAFTPEELATFASSAE